VSDDWKVSLECVEGGSRKFWRARCEGTTLYVNFGRIGTQGQTQVKQFSSPADCEKEMASLERSKRKKGYQDAGVAGGEEDAASEEDAGENDEAPETPAPAPSKAAPASTSQRPVLTADLVLQSPERRVDMRLVQEGIYVRIVAAEQYESARAAVQAFERLAAALKEEGYRPAKLPEGV
jgi:predicted DNA-binding WGR domain protein